MTTTPPSAAKPQAAAPEAEKTGGANLRRVAIIAAGGFAALMLLLFIFALVLALATNVEQSGAVIRLIRDLVIIFLALEGILIVFALAVLIVQVAKLVNLLQTEIKPILENTQDTLQTAKGTVQFVSENVTGPIVRLSGFMAGLQVLLSNVFGIRKAIRRSKDDAAKEEPAA